MRVTWGRSMAKRPFSVRRARPAAATHTRSRAQSSRSSSRSVTWRATLATWLMSSIWPSSMARLLCSSRSMAST